MNRIDDVSCLHMVNPMAQPEHAPSADSSTVASCAAADCRHNENENCTADDVRVQLTTHGQPICGTCTPDTPKVRP